MKQDSDLFAWEKAKEIFVKEEDREPNVNQPKDLLVVSAIQTGYKRAMLERIDLDDHDFIMTALNAYWNEAHFMLGKNTLGDIERKNYDHQIKECNRIMKHIESL